MFVEFQQFLSRTLALSGNQPRLEEEEEAEEEFSYSTGIP